VNSRSIFRTDLSANRPTLHQVQVKHAIAIKIKLCRAAAHNLGEVKLPSTAIKMAKLNAGFGGLINKPVGSQD